MLRLSRPLRSAVGSTLVVVGAWLWGLAVSAAPTENAVPVSFALQESSVTVHEPVFVELRIENSLAEQVTFELGFQEKANYHFILTEPGGSTVSPPGLQEGGMGATGHMALKAGSTFERRVLVNEWYQFSKPGRYGIQLQVTALAIRTASGTLIANEASSPPMLLQVDPADPTRLSEVCQNLLESVRTSRGYAKRAEDAVALSYILDPVAVPYLAKLAKTPQLEDVGVLGLARIANAEGIEEVLSNLGTDDPELERSIRNALECLKRGCRFED
jgi:hypothetical protein